jgi:hypothetical protein
MKEKSEYWKSIIQLLILYIIISIIFGIAKTEMLLDYVPANSIKLARLSSYISLLITSFVSGLTILLVFAAQYFLLNIIYPDFNTEDYSLAFGTFIFIFCLHEIFRVVYFYVIVYNESVIFNTPNDVSLLLEKTGWNYLTSVFNIIFILIASAAYFSFLIFKSKIKNLKLTLISSGMLLVVFMLLQIDSLFLIYSKFYEK